MAMDYAIVEIKVRMISQEGVMLVDAFADVELPA
jgi:hypothetical protein